MVGGTAVVGWVVAVTAGGTVVGGTAVVGWVVAVTVGGTVVGGTAVVGMVSLSCAAICRIAPSFFCFFLGGLSLLSFSLVCPMLASFSSLCNKMKYTVKVVTCYCYL